MDDDAIKFTQRRQRQLLTWTLRQLGLRETRVDLLVHGPSPLPPEQAKVVEAAIERQVQAPVFARRAFPWRFEDYSLAALADPPGDAELENLMWEVDRRHREAIQREEEVGWRR